MIWQVYALHGLSNDLVARAQLQYCAQVNKNRIPLTDNAVIEGVRQTSLLCARSLRLKHAEGLLQPPGTVLMHLAMQVLGKHGIICIEDLVHEIHTCGPAFKQVKTLEYRFIAVWSRPAIQASASHINVDGLPPHRGFAAYWRE